MDISLAKGDLIMTKSLILAGFDLSRVKSSQFKAIKTFAKQSFIEKCYTLVKFNESTRSNAQQIVKYL